MRPIHLKKMLRIIALLPVFWFASVQVFAQVPVVDAYQQSRAQQHRQRPASVSQLLEVVRQLRRMESEVQALRGRIDTLSHRLQQAELAQRRGYEDLDKRLQHASSAAPGVNPASASHSQQPAGDLASMQPTLVLDEAGIKEQRAYRVAYNLMKDRRFGAAMTALDKFVALYPKGQFSPNAFYWLGELNLIAGQPKAAEDAFNHVVTTFPQHPKAADALLKLGVIAVDTQQWRQAKRYFRKVGTQYPKTAAAQLAKAKLLMLQKLGH